MLHGIDCTLPVDVSLPIKSGDSFIQDVANHIQDLHAFAKHNIVVHQNYSQDYYNKDRHEIKYEVGDQVCLFSPFRTTGLSAKLSDHLHGPYTVLEQTGPNNYELAACDPGITHRS